MVIFFIIIVLGVSIAESLRLYLLIKKNKSVIKEVNKRVSELAYLLYLTSSAISEDLPIDKAFPMYLNRLKETVGWMYHSFFRLDEENQVLPLRFTGYLPDWYVEELSTKMLVKVGDASAGRAVSTKQPVAINVTSVDPRFQNVTSFSERTGYKCVSGYPVMGRLKVHGSFCAYGSKENMFTLHDTQYLLTVANLYGAILENKLLTNYLHLNSDIPKKDT